MSDFTVYPAIDLRDGQVVRLMEGNPTRQTTYSENPADIARRWLSAGAQWLHVVNLDGAFNQVQDLALSENDTANQRALKDILKVTREFGTQLQFGGGLRSLDAIEMVLGFGMDRVIIGTIAVEQPEILKDALAHYGADRIVVGIDARDGQVRIRGWQDDSRVNAADLAHQMRTLGVQTVIYTDISRDGMGRGLNLTATKKLADTSGLEVIASGGVHTLEDLVAARDAGLAGAIVGRALYEGTVDLKTAIHEVA